jgi:hypothetical protein
MKTLYCDEHGSIMRAGEIKASWGEVTVTFFCPICRREVFPDDPLTEIERDGKPAATFAEWKARDDMPVLDMGRINLEPSDG